MIALTDLAGLAGSATALAAASTCLPGAAHIRKSQRILLVSAVVIAALIPFGGLPLAAYVRGATGELSIPSLVLLVLAIARFLSSPLPENEPGTSFPPELGGRRSNGRQALLLLVALAAAWLYPMALGIGLLDPYRLGFGSPWFVGVLLLLALAACFSRHYLPAICISLAVLAWSTGWHESHNLWDYLLDPLLAIYAIGALARSSIRLLLKYT